MMSLLFHFPIIEVITSSSSRLKATDSFVFCLKKKIDYLTWFEFQMRDALGMPHIPVSQFHFLLISVFNSQINIQIKRTNRTRLGALRIAIAIGCIWMLRIAIASLLLFHIFTFSSRCTVKRIACLNRIQAISYC